MSLETLAPTEIALALATSLAVGGMVGLERQRRSVEEGRAALGGVRTFPLVALLGALVALAAGSLGPGAAGGAGLLVAGFLAVLVLFALGSRRDEAPRRRRDDGEQEQDHASTPGLASALAGLLVYVLGALPFLAIPGLAFPARLLLEGALGTLVVALLVLRRPMHAFAERLSQEDMLASVRFALVALVVLPLLPDRSFGPFEAINPFGIGVVVVLIAGISYVGYVAMRLFGARRGLGLAALAGGLVSSTAVTLSFAPRGRAERALAPACAMAIALAATIPFVRVLIELAVIHPPLARAAAPSLGAMLGLAILGCLVLWRRTRAKALDEAPGGMQNPFRLRQALRLGLVYALIRLVVAAAWQQFGQSGLLVSAGISGLADVDAITLSVARMHQGGLATDIATTAVSIAVVTNTLVKSALALALGGWRVGWPVAAVLVPSAGGGLAVTWLWS